jgi:hypothetical protein
VRRGPCERNHLWLPSLGIDEPIHHWSCTRSGILADVVYSWGCAGSNNEYLMGHAFGVFDRLYAAYPGDSNLARWPGWRTRMGT